VRTPWKTRFTTIPRAWGLLFMAIVVIGGLYVGIFTPTESGANWRFCGFDRGFSPQKGGRSRLRPDIVFESGGLTSQILFILMGRDDVQLSNVCDSFTCCT